MTGVGRTMWLVATVGVLVAAWAIPSRAAEQGGFSSGQDLFRSYCVSCHGADARGTGPLASSLTKRPADLTVLAKSNGGDFPAETVGRIIDGRNPVKGHGGGDMPVWGEALLKTQGAGTETAVKERIEALVAYLRTVQQ